LVLRNFCPNVSKYFPRDTFFFPQNHREASRLL